MIQLFTKYSLNKISENKWFIPPWDFVSEIIKIHQFSPKKKLIKTTPKADHFLEIISNEKNCQIDQKNSVYNSKCFSSENMCLAFSKSQCGLILDLAHRTEVEKHIIQPARHSQFFSKPI